MDKSFKKELNWEEKARINPLYAIMSDKEFKEKDTELSEANLSLFFSKGKRIWNEFFEGETAKFENRATTNVLEFGCGMGRLIKVPGEKGFQCHGVDISETQVELARRYLTESNYHFHTVRDNRIPVSENSMDYVYSFAVLQHIRKLSDFNLALDELCRVLKPGGTLKIQLPTIEGNRFCKGRRKFFYSIPFEEKSLVFYWAKRLKIVPMIRFVKHDHWGGASYYIRLGQVIQQLKDIEIDLVSYSTAGFVLLRGTKKGN
jgi:ubiquinone/menaquinone biosynthesis C-methylase UbiE